MILVDANILIAIQRGKDRDLVSKAAKITMVVCGATRAEMLRGQRNELEKQRILSILSAGIQITTPEAVWDEMGTNVSLLERKGVIVPFPDSLLATIAIHHGIDLWSRTTTSP